MINVELRAAEGGSDSKLLVETLTNVYLRRALAQG